MTSYYLYPYTNDYRIYRLRVTGLTLLNDIAVCGGGGIASIPEVPQSEPNDKSDPIVVVPEAD